MSGMLWIMLGDPLANGTRFFVALFRHTAVEPTEHHFQISIGIGNHLLTGGRGQATGDTFTTTQSPADNAKLLGPAVTAPTNPNSPSIQRAWRTMGKERR